MRPDGTVHCGVATDDSLGFIVLSSFRVDLFHVPHSTSDIVHDEEWFAVMPLTLLSEVYVWV